MRFKNTLSKLTVVAVLAIILVVGISQPLMAQTDSVPSVKKDTVWREWNVRIAPYVWLLGIKGQIAVQPDPAQLPLIPPPISQLPGGYSIHDIDLSPQEVLNSLKFAIMLAGRYKHNRFITQFNVSSLVLESNAIAPFDYIFKNNTLRFAYAGGDLAAGYRVVRTKKLEFDLMLGLKFVYTKVGLTTDLIGQMPVSGVVSKIWADPVLATNIAYRPFKWLELVGYGDVGPTIYNTELTYQVATSANFLITKHFYMSAGYRNYYVSAPVKEASFTGTLSGYLVKFGFQF